MSDNRAQRVKKRLDLHLSMTVREIFEGIDQERNRPPEMEYFDRFFREFGSREKRIVNSAGKKIIGFYCMNVPEELVYAAGAFPVRLCAGSAEAAEAGEIYFPDVSCPMAKSSTGFASVPVLPFYQECDLVIIPATCDWKAKLGEIIGQWLPVLTLDIPKVKFIENARRYWISEILRIKKEIEKITRKKITARRLNKAISMIHAAQKEFRRFQEIRKSPVHVISGRDAAAVVNAWFYDHAESWTAAMKKLNNALEARILEGARVSPASAPRVLLTGAPVAFPNWKIPNLIESSGGALVCDELCTSNRYLNDMVAIDERRLADMIHAIADRYLLPCSCPVFSDMSDRKNKLFTMIDDYNIEGVVYHVLKGCHPYDVELRTIEKEFAQRGISQLKIETDYNPEDTEQLRTRIEAFLETLKGRRYAQ